MPVTVFFTPDQVFGEAEGLELGAYKSRLVNNLIERDAPRPEPIEPVAQSLLYQVHDKNYVDGVFSGETPNGFRTRDPNHLLAIRHAVGNYLAATNHAMTDDSRVAFSLTSGFHHAGFDGGWGYCTFNALILAAEVHAKGKRVLVLDGDAHFGDGCASIIDRLELANIDYRHRELWPFEEIYTNEYDLVLYQAGADDLKADLYGEGRLSLDEFKERDRRVSRACKESGTPLVVNLAGGYGAPTRKMTCMAHLSTHETMSKIYFP